MEISYLAYLLRLISSNLPDHITFAEFKITYYESSPLPVCEVMIAVDGFNSFWDWSAIGLFMTELTILDAINNLDADINVEFDLGFIDTIDYIPRWPDGQNWINLH